MVCPPASAALATEYKAGVSVVSCAWPREEDEIMGSHLNIRMPFPLPRAHTSHMNEHEATVMHPGLIINTAGFPKQSLRSRCVMVSAELSLARGRLRSGEPAVSAETCHICWHAGGLCSVVRSVGVQSGAVKLCRRLLRAQSSG